MKNITIYSYSEKHPENGENIFYLTRGQFGSDAIRYGTVEYDYQNDDGDSISYPSDEIPPEGFDLVCRVSGDYYGELFEDSYWWSIDEIYDWAETLWKELDKSNELVQDESEN